MSELNHSMLKSLQKMLDVDMRPSGKNPTAYSDLETGIVFVEDDNGPVVAMSQGNYTAFVEEPAKPSSPPSSLSTPSE